MLFRPGRFLLLPEDPALALEEFTTEAQRAQRFGYLSFAVQTGAISR